MKIFTPQIKTSLKQMEFENRFFVVVESHTFQSPPHPTSIFIGERPLKCKWWWLKMLSPSSSRMCVCLIFSLKIVFKIFPLYLFLWQKPSVEAMWMIFHSSFYWKQYKLETLSRHYGYNIFCLNKKQIIPISKIWCC